MLNSVHVIINTAALKHNLLVVKMLAPGKRIMAMVKGDGYGHGIENVVDNLQGADAFGVSSIAEARKLRMKNGVTKPLILMSGFLGQRELMDICNLDLTPVVHNVEQVELLEKITISNPISIWLKINTGMNRLGINILEAEEIHRRLMACKNVKNPFGIMTHFFEAEAINKNTTIEQVRVFDKVVSNLCGYYSLANSAAVIARPETQYDWIRPGIMLYGVSPFKNRCGLEHGLKPVMIFRAKLIAINYCKKGQRVGYGGLWTCPENMLIGVVNAGYADGYPWYAPSGTPILINGTRFSLVGRVSMNMITIDLRGAKNLEINSPVTLWGEGLSVEEIASNCGTIPYVLLTGVSFHVRRILV